MLQAEKKSLIQFVSVFVGLNIIFLIILSTLYYNYQKKIYTEILQDEMIYYTETAYESVYYAQNIADLDEYLLHHPKFDIAMMDKNKNIIYPNPAPFKVKFKQGFFREDTHYFFIKTIELENIENIHYLIVRGDAIDDELNKTKQTILIVLIFSIVFFGAVIFILSKIFLRPLRQYIELLNKFITDAIHELNTPISVLSMSLETMEVDELSQKNLKSTNRMLIATRTLSHLYNDLTFTMFSSEHYPVQKTDLKELILQRIDYFMPLASTKNLSFTKELRECEIMINERLMGRIIDNLLSNAIKYNKKNGNIKIELNENSFSISDTGIGFDQSKSKEIFERYKRFDNSNGGFGLGLSIVKSLCDLYDIEIEVVSKKDIGTTFTLTWNNSRIIHT
ncbi:MAG: HAMP domain-containing sensor histidine kinase [Sulfurimonas sp.]|uniref:sensor histidine kinase n=1 Tax=Sulfurimonas sp. TaxID=2022749 RepID=UPI00262130CE|nr:HAMP domain-containing sensor histidine kinase [Sulfurimonas sp.]MDD5401433.1 HAMP domain-containing sensor histidine kinase [Sulfurimonas sp.]